MALSKQAHCLAEWGPSGDKLLIHCRESPCPGRGSLQSVLLAEPRVQEQFSCSKPHTGSVECRCSWRRGV
eukprot:6263712-Amphidinium_carterae.1